MISEMYHTNISSEHYSHRIYPDSHSGDTIQMEGHTMLMESTLMHVTEAVHCEARKSIKEYNRSTLHTAEGAMAQT